VFGVSGLEFVILAVLALVVFGPDRLPGVAQEAGRMIRQLRRMAQEARDEVTGAFPEFEDMGLGDLDPRQFVRRQLLEEKDDLNAAVDGRPARQTQRRARVDAPPAVDVPTDAVSPVVRDSPANYEVSPPEPPSGPSPWDADAT
jgi:sec-independent protein translocase protein TatB